MTPKDPFTYRYGIRPSAKYIVPAPQAEQHATKQSTPNPSSDLSDLIGVEDSWTLEKVCGSFSKDDPGEAILGEKSSLARMAVGAIVYAITQRQEIKKENLNRILYQEVDIGNQIKQRINGWPDYAPPGGDPLESQLHRLEDQRRSEEVDAWRDIARLKDRLLVALTDYRSAARTHEMISDNTRQPRQQ